jgi:hypothetical protein
MAEPLGNSNVHTIDEARQKFLRLDQIIKNSGLVKNNFTATTNPAVTDDADDGYEAGSVWINVTLNRVYILESATVGAANWILLAPEGGSGPADATYIVQTPHADLSAEQALSALATGILKSTTVTGVISIAVAGTDYSAPGHTHPSTDVTDFTEAAQDAIGAMIGVSLIYVDATPLLARAALTGDVTAPQDSNVTTLATVNANVGTFGSVTQAVVVTVNGKGIITAIANATIAIPSTAVTDFAAAVIALLTDANIPNTITLDNITQIATRSHTSLTDIGTNTHADIDTHIAAANPHSGSQPLDALLTALAALVTAADQMLYFTGVDTVALTGLTAFARTLLDDADAATARATLDVPSNAEAVLDTIIDAKGDLIAGSAADTPARFAVGSNFYVLLAHSGETLGMAWGPMAVDADSGILISGLTAPTRLHFRLDINTLTADASPDGAADYVATYDASAGVHKKVLLDDLPTGAGYTDEEAQDAVGGILADTTEIDLAYSDLTPSISASIVADSVVVGKLHATATDVFFGRDTAAAGAGEEISVAAAKTLLNLAGSNTGDQTVTLTGDVTGSGTGSFAATIAADAVTDAKLRESAGYSVIGRAASTTGNPADIVAALAGQVLRRGGGAANVAFGAVDVSDVNAVTGSLPILNGGTGASTAAGARTNLDVPSNAEAVLDTDLGTNVGTFLATPSSANLAAALTDETGTGLAVFATNPVLTTPNLGTPSAAVLTNATGLPPAGLTSAARRQSKLCRIDNPVTGDALQVTGIPDAATIKVVRYIHVGGTSVVFNIEHRAEATPFTTSATVVWTAPGKTTSSTSTEETSFDDATVAASSVLTVVIGTVTGSVTNMLVVIEYEVD